MPVVLLVEDDEALRVIAESAVQEAGYEARTASGPEQALALLAEHPVDIMFVDIALAGDNEAGLKLATAAVEVKPGLPVLYTTGQGVTDGMRALFVQNSGFLAKPYTVSHVRTALANILGGMIPAGVRDIGAAAKPH
jgi:DNA-binding NtrC family response regulator